MERKKKYKINDEKVVEIILDKMLDKHNITIGEIKELVKDTEGKIEGTPWYQYYTMTQKEHDAWKEWSLNFMYNEIRPRHSMTFLRNNFSWLDLMWGLKIEEYNEDIET